MPALESVAGELATGHASRSDASPVMAEWFLGWNDTLRDPGREALRSYVRRLAGSWGTIDQEVARQWLVIDWLIRVAAPTWLRGAGLFEQADQLARRPGIGDRRSLADVTAAAEMAARGAHAAEERAWTSVADLAQPGARDAGGRPPWRPAPGSSDPTRVSAWGGLADGTRQAIPNATRLLGPASRATGYGLRESEDAPPGWRAAVRAVKDAASAVAWNATRSVVLAPEWSWQVPIEAAWSVAHTAARSALEPVEAEFFASAHVLVDRMFRVTEDLDAGVALGFRSER